MSISLVWLGISISVGGVPESLYENIIPIKDANVFIWMGRQFANLAPSHSYPPLLSASFIIRTDSSLSHVVILKCLNRLADFRTG